MRNLNARAGVIALLATGVLAILILAGSRWLRYFDAALVGYLVATVFAVLGITYRFVLWLSRPPTRLYWERGWQLFASWRVFRRYWSLIPKAFWTDLLAQDFIRPRPRGSLRWLMHLALFWGVILSSLITFPLVFGWFVFRSPAEHLYQLYVLGFPTIVFEPRSWFGWTLIHALDFTAALVILGVAIALWRRWTDREVMPGQQFGFDFVPLFMLLAISVTGIFLTIDQWLWQGKFYWFMALTHEAVVILAILYIPFGKFWHVLERPASIGVVLYRTVMMREGSQRCARCGQGFASTPFVNDLKQTLQDLDQNYTMNDQSTWLQDYCPTCKRVLRGNTYFTKTQQGFL